VSKASPALFTANSTGSGQGAILNEDGSVNSTSNPAPAGSIVVLFGTGEGQTNPPGLDGLISSSTFPKPLLAVGVRIGGVDADVLYAGAAPSLVAGVVQVNARIPEAVSGSSVVPVQISVGGVQSPTVTLAVAQAQARQSSLKLKSR
jgi:uncharacterized protein (TIGR03437 family)